MAVVCVNCNTEWTGRNVSCFCSGLRIGAICSVLIGHPVKVTDSFAFRPNLQLQLLSQIDQRRKKRAQEELPQPAMTKGKSKKKKAKNGGGSDPVLDAIKRMEGKFDSMKATIDQHQERMAGFEHQL